MKKELNKIKLFIIMGLIVGIMPFNAYAEELKTGTADSQAGITKIPLTIKVAEDESPVKNVSLSCDVSDSNLSCSFEGTSSVLSKDGIFTNGTGFETGETLIGALVITNNSDSTKNDITYTIKNKKSGKTISKTVTVKAKQEAPKYNNDPYLKSIKFSTGTLTPEFSPEVMEYTLYEIKDTIRTVSIRNYECRTGSLCDVKDPSGGAAVKGKTITLNEGENKVTLEVVDDSGNNKVTYTFNIIRGESTYNSAKLKTLSFKNYTLTPAFSKDVTEYTLTVPNIVTSLISDINYAPEDEKANVSTGGLDNFAVGDNKLTVTVDNVTGSESVTYTVTVKRMGKEDIEIIMYINNEITFLDSEGIQTILKEEEFKTLYPEEWQKIENEEYKFDEDGKVITEEPKEEVKEEPKKKKKNNTVLIIILVVLGLLIIIGSGFLIFRKKKPSKFEVLKYSDKEITYTDAKGNKKILSEEDFKKKYSDEWKKIENKEYQFDENGKIIKNDKKEKEIDETGVEEKAIKEEQKNNTDSTMDIDEALSDLMSTKQYDFKDED